MQLCGSFADSMETSIFVLLFIFNVASAILAAITAYLYFWLPSVQNAHGTCLFHFSLNIALMHAILTIYKTGSRISSFIRKACVTEAYVYCFVATAVHVWSAILSYNTWREVKEIQLVNNQMYSTKRLKWYRFLGYGVPMLYVTFLIIYTHDYLYHTYPLRFCHYEMQFYQAFPSIGGILLNVFYFADSQRRLFKLFIAVTQARNETSALSESFMTKLKYKVCLNLRLCLTMSIPFGLSSTMFFIVKSLMADFYNSSFDLLEMISSFLTSLEGIFIFLVAVAFRKLIIKSFIRHRHQSCLGCIRIPECLTRRSAKDDVEKTVDDEMDIYSEEEGGARSLQARPLQTSFRNKDGS